MNNVLTCQVVYILAFKDYKDTQVQCYFGTYTTIQYLCERLFSQELICYLRRAEFALMFYGIKTMCLPIHNLHTWFWVCFFVCLLFLPLT